ncbi:MAG TPA: ATP-binding protein [Polyangia bacterium]
MKNPKKRALRTAAVAVAVWVGVLALSIASVQRERERLVDEFGATTRRQLHESVEALSARLEALEQDTRLLADLVEQESAAQAGLDAQTEHRVWQSAFRSMAAVVPQYRVVALVNDEGIIDVVGVAPAETPSVAAALMPATRRFGQDVGDRRAKAFGQTERLGSRSFFLYGTPVSHGRAIVIASDVAVFLGAVAWTPLPSARLFVTDPAGVIWGGCEMSVGCHVTDAKTVENELPSRRTRGGRSVRIATLGSPALELSQSIERPTGVWGVTWVASTESIVEREQVMISRVVLTAVAVAVAFAAVGAFVLRQQRQAVELEGRLRYAQELANARQTSQSIVDNAPLGVLGLGEDGRVLLANGFLVERLGPVRLGQPLDQAFTEKAGAAWAREIEPLLRDAGRGPEGAGAKPAGASNGLPVPPAGAGEGAPRQQIRSIATGTQQFLVRIVPVRGNELGVRTFALVEDQSELRALENHLVRAEKLITVGVLSAGIAHEIGSPLAVIRGRAEQTLRSLSEDRGDVRRASDLRVIIKHIDTISATIRQLLDFSRRQSIERHAVVPAEAFEQARVLLQWKTASRRVGLVFEAEPGTGPLSADPDQLQQVLVNLILNACDASAEGDEVRISAGPGEDGFVRITVSDRGCGIAPEHMNAVFDPFFTTKKKGEGTGLGLSIAASIVRNHGGQINLDSTPGRGTQVTILWPDARRPTSAAASTAEDPAPERRRSHA